MLDFAKTSEGHMKVRKQECSCWLTEAGGVGLPWFCPMFTSLVLKKKGEKRCVSKSPEAEPFGLHLQQIE